jgi:succinate dehydrogenase / fumarate reductase, iron-sulfur subunit
MGARWQPGFSQKLSKHNLR